tara:strand:- start:8010 stop:8942 length:933 start_codon:yes stop_codon:yes gene_type:complete
MRTIRDNIIKRALKTGAKIILPENSDIRVKEASKELKKIGINIVNIEDFNSKDDKYVDYLSNFKFTKNWSRKMFLNYLNNPLHFGTTLVSIGEADGMVAGSINSTADVIRTYIRIIGIKPNSKWISSIFLMVNSNGKSAYTFTDCGVIPEPTPEQSISIAKNASEFHHLLTEEQPRIAFLSFSTKGSSEHYRVKKVQETVELFGKKYPKILHEGEIQFDAAIDSQISQRKIENSKIKGNANIFVFPNLDAGNIAYKITERLAGYSAWGPLLQGLNKPLHDLSRGCSIQDIIDISVIAALQKKEDLIKKAI